MSLSIHKKLLWALLDEAYEEWSHSFWCKALLLKD